MIIDGIEYEPVNAGERRLQIVVLHRGFVFVGEVERTDREVIIHNARNVRRWGTTYGLGEIALNGPTASTVLDICGTIRFTPLAEVCAYDCNAAKWNR